MSMNEVIVTVNLRHRSTIDIQARSAKCGLKYIFPINNYDRSSTNLLWKMILLILWGFVNAPLALSHYPFIYHVSPPS